MRDLPPLDPVSETALHVAASRARETERRHPLFRDPYARLLAGERGEALLRARLFADGSDAVAVRTAVLDEMLLRAVTQSGVRCVLNLGAGLDTRPYRLGLPPDLLWIEADLPGILDYKEQRLAGEPTRCRVERIAADLREADDRQRLLERLYDNGTPLVLSEGVLVYLSPKEVADLAHALAVQAQARWWLLDLMSPQLVQWSRRFIPAGSVWRFAPPEGTAFFRPLGWIPIEVRSAWLESRRLHRESWFLRLLWMLGPASVRQGYRTQWQCVLLRSALGDSARSR